MDEGEDGRFGAGVGVLRGEMKGIGGERGTGEGK